MTFHFSQVVKSQIRLLLKPTDLQQSNCSPAQDFKPGLNSFNQDMAHARKALPKGEQA